MKTSSRPRKTMARNPSHFGSYNQSGVVGRSSASLASIGSIGGAIANAGGLWVAMTFPSVKSGHARPNLKEYSHGDPERTAHDSLFPTIAARERSLTCFRAFVPPSCGDAGGPPPFADRRRLNPPSRMTGAVHRYGGDQ